MRALFISALCTLTLLLLGVATQANAAPPDCPCWADGEAGLLAFVMDTIDLADIDRCDSHVMEQGSRAVINAPEMTVEATVRNGSPYAMQCNEHRDSTDYTAIESSSDAHKCVRDVTAVCRGLGF
jgi:hypothetical protein